MATRTWNGGGGDNLWLTSANWDVVPVAGDDLIFAGAVVSNSNNFAVDTYFASITFAVGASAFTLAGNRLSVGTITNSSSNLQTISCAIDTSWSPRQITTAGWYDASDSSTITHAANAVSQWNDKKGNGLNLVQATGTAKPTTNVATIGGLNAISFDGTGDNMATASNPFGATINNAFVIFAYDVRTIANSTLFSLSGTENGANRWQSHATWGDGVIYFDTGGVAGVNRVSAASGFTASTDHIVSFYGSTTDNVQQVYTDGSLKVGDATGHAVPTAGNIRIGTGDGSSNFDNAEIGECIIINGTVTSTNRQLLEGYLAWKWGMTVNLPTAHPYKNDGPGLVTTIDANSNDITISGIISGFGSIVKSGANILTLSGANTYTGTTTVQGGTIKAGVASVANVSGAFGNNSAITLNNTSGVILDITGFNTQIGSLASGGATGGNVTLGAATLTIGGSGTTSYDGVISGTGGLTINGLGSLTLTRAQTYTGTTIITSGRLRLSGGNDRIVTSSVVTVDAQGIFDISNILQTVTTITFTGSARFRADVGVTTGLLTVTGTATISGLAEVGEYPSPVISTAYTILSAATLTSTFQPVSTDLTLGGRTFQISYPTNTVVLTDNGAAKTFLMFF